MAVVDDLQVKIQADAVRANDAIDKLIGKLDRLSTSIGSLDTSRLNSLSNGVTRLTTAMAGMSNVKTSEFTRLAKNIEKLAALDASKLNQSAGSIHQFANSLGSLNTINVTDSAKNIAELAKGISQLGYKSSTKAIQNIPQLATAMHQLMTTLSTAPQVSQNIINMTNALAKLARTGSSSGKAATSLGRSLESYTKSTTRATKGTFSLAGAIGKIYATYWLLFRAMGKIKSAIDISSQLTEVQNVVDVTFGKMSHKIEEFTENSIEKFGMSELSAKKYASTFQAMGSAMGIDTALIGTANKFLNQQTAGYVGLSNSMADVSVTLTKLTADMSSFYNVEQKAVAEDLSAIFTGQTRPLRQYGIDLTEATLKEWALSEGMNANIKSMTQAEKTMLRYQYVLAHTGAAQGDFERTVNTWANQVRILKQNFEQLGAVVGGTFINMLKPLVKALNNAMSHIIAFAQTVSNALGKIFGWTYEAGSGGVTSDMENAADESEALAGSLSDAEKNAKKLKSHLLGIDELNVYNPDEDKETASSGGAGGGANADDGGWKKTESFADAFESELDTLYKLGAHISDTLSKAMEGIEWEKAYEKASNWGTGLANFLNGLINPRLFENVGKTVAGSLNTSLHFLNSFGKTFNWKNFGASLSASVKGFFSTWDAGLTGETLSTFASGILQAMTGAIEELKDNDTFKDIGQKIVDFVCGIDWLSVNWDLINFFTSLSTALTEFPKDFATGVLQGIVDRIFGEGEVEIKFPESLKDKFVNSFIEFMPGWIEDVKKNIQEIKDAFSFKEWMANLDGMVLAFQESWETTKVNTEEKIQEFWDKVLPWFTAEKWIEVFNNIGTALKGVWDSIVLWWQTTAIYNWWNEDVKPWFTKEKWSKLLEKIPEAFKDAFEDAKKWVKEKVQSMYDIVSGIVQKMKDAISSIGDKISSAVEKAKSLGGSISAKFSVVDGFATGGYPTSASLFWAGENGVPEILGTVGGKTAVAGGAEITGIRDAVYDVGNSETTLLRMAVSLLETIAAKDTATYIDGRELVNAYDERKSRNGFSFT